MITNYLLLKYTSILNMANIWIMIVLLSAISMASGKLWSQEYLFEEVGRLRGLPIFVITNKGTGKCVDNSGASLENGSRIQMWGCNETPAQMWMAISVQGTDYFQLKNVGSFKCIDVNAQSVSDGGRLHQWTCGSQYSQQWRQNEDGHIVGRQSGKCYDIEGQNAASGIGLHIWSCL